MALTKYPLNLKWRSSHGAITGQKTRAGNIARLHSESVQRGLAIKWVRDFTMRSITEQWRSMSAILRDSWDSFGLSFPQPDRYGNNIALSGFNWFVKLNVSYLLFQNNLNISPPPDPNPGYSPSLGFIDPGPGNPIYLELSPFPPPLNNGILVHRSLNQPQSIGKKFPLEFFRFLGTGTGFLTIIATISDLKSGGLNNFFSAVAIDNYGRQDIVYTQTFNR